MSTVIIIMINFSVVNNYFGDDMLLTVFMPQYLAVDLVYQLFDDYVG